MDDKRRHVITKKIGTVFLSVILVAGGISKSVMPDTVAAAAVPEKAEQTILFEVAHEEDTVIYSKNQEENIYNFAARGGGSETPVITYAVENDTENDETPIGEIASIDYKGQLTVKKGGYNIKIIAAVAGDDKYEAASIEYGLTIKNNDGDLISFPITEKKYILNGDTRKISSEAASKKYLDDNGKMTYTYLVNESSIQKVGIAVHETTGELFISDYGALSEAMIQNGNVLTVTVFAKKEAGTKKKGISDNEEREVYGACESSYQVTISFARISPGYKLQNPDTHKEMMPDGENGWYQTAVEVVPSEEGYKIAKNSPVPENFKKSVLIDEQGNKKRYIYLKDESGNIAAPYILGIQLDMERPVMLETGCSAPMTLREQGLAFYKDKVMVTMKARDATSGIDKFKVIYRRVQGVSSKNLESFEEEIPAAEAGEGIYRAQLLMPGEETAQIRGTIQVSAIDQAGLESKPVDYENTLIVDRISPICRVSYTLENGNGTAHHYFQGDVEFTVEIEEANFEQEMVEVLVSKNGENPYAVKIQEWDTIEKTDVYTGKFTLSGEGDYKVFIRYGGIDLDTGGKADYSGNKTRYHESLSLDGENLTRTDLEEYISELITIDTTKPRISMDYYDNQTNRQTEIITVEERNFRASDIVVDIKETKVVDINNHVIQGMKDRIQSYLRNPTSWKKVKGESCKYEAKISRTTGFEEGIYDIKIGYTDLALNQAEVKQSGEFIIDDSAPGIEDMKVEYSTPIAETFLNKITFGYYNPKVTITFTACDAISGIGCFIWSFQKEETFGETDVSNMRQYRDSVIKATEDVTDKSKYTASLVLPKDKADQLRGSIAFSAVDKCSNTSDKITDTNYRIVVDTISPTMEAEYSASSLGSGSRIYYNGDAMVTFRVAEANLYKEDVEIERCKNGGKYKKIQAEWKKVSKDMHIAVCRIPEGDGEYQYKVRYKDRSDNKMRTFFSKRIIKDTKKPVVNVEYAKYHPRNVILDGDGKSRAYFDEQQTAAITIKEHNFSQDKINIIITAKDAAGRDLRDNSCYTMSSWKKNGDVYERTITYEGDANYTFHLVCTDRAGNQAKDYETDYFTVDKTAPEDLVISYSTSVGEKFLQGISFGFYQAKATATIQATDNISGVYGFQYSYRKASGVSNLNGELVNQAVESSKITVNGVTATARFEIPREALGHDRQFNGTVQFQAKDRCENKSAEFSDMKRLVVDNISPVATVEYSRPVKIAEEIAYYNGEVEGILTIKEANFYPEDVRIQIIKNGVSCKVRPVWQNEDSDVHVAAFSMKEDGNYFVTVSCTDQSGNKMAAYTSREMRVDTKIEKPVITVNGLKADGKAFKDQVVLGVRFEDENFENYKITLTRTRYGDKNVDVTESFIGNKVSLNSRGGTGNFDTFGKKREIDGIYVMTVSMTDKAGHFTEETVIFTVNRFGSVYEYSDYLASLIQEGGICTKGIREDLIITEYNPDKLVQDSLDISISCNGKPAGEVFWEVMPEISGQAIVGESGWYQYRYRISKANFVEDGVYKIAVSSRDQTGNTQETTHFRNKEICFRVDTAAPEISSVTGLEKEIINAKQAEVKYTIYDTVGLADIKVYVNHKLIHTITDFGDDPSNYEGSFILKEQSSVQTIRLEAKDLAGNITDTSAKDFKSAFTFHRQVTISTRFLVRFCANRLFFWGIIFLAGSAILLWKIRKRI